MSLPLVLGCVWVLAAAATAMLPMRLQMVPGIALLATAPVLIVWLSVAVAWWIGVLALLAFLSMFRNPLRYLIARARGETLEIPR